MVGPGCGLAACVRGVRDKILANTPHVRNQPITGPYEGGDVVVEGGDVIVEGGDIIVEGGDVIVERGDVIWY